MAPTLARSFAPASLASISIPVMIVVGDSDRVTPVDRNASYFAKQIKGARLEVLTGGVGHFVFLDLPTPKGKGELPDRAVDPPNVDREAIHERVAQMAISFFAEALK
jgi:predicted dienelactone hydrolase